MRANVHGWSVDWILSGVVLCSILRAPVLVAQTTMLDYTFADSGTVRSYVSGSGEFNDRASAVAIQPDGKIVVIGTSGAIGPHTEFAVARYDTDGTFDAGFGTNGSVRFPINGSNGTDDEAYGVALQPDGKIIVAGFAFISSTTGVEFAVARLNPNGTLDNSFGGGSGTSLAGIGSSGGLAEAYSVALQEDGKIVLGGYCESPPLNITFALARFDSSGVVDGSFGNSGTVRTSLSTSRAYGYSVALQPDGKILLAGTDGSLFALARYQSGGSVDSAFGTNGITLNAITGSNGNNDNAYGVAVQKDGRIVLAGRAADSVFHFGFALARYNANGTLDSTFAHSGTSMTFIYGDGLRNGFARGLVLQPDGRIVMVGTSYDTSGHGEFAVARFDTNGTLDNSFGTKGTTRNPIIGGTGFADGAASAAIQSNGKIVAVGSSMDQSNNTAFAAARYLGHNNAVAVAEPPKLVPARFELFQNYPNPFNPSTRIGYRVEGIGDRVWVTLKVYDVLGRGVATLVNERKAPGSYEVRFDATLLASGVYFYKLTAGNFVQTRKMLVMK